MTRFVIRPAGFGGLLKLQALPTQFGRLLTYLRREGHAYQAESRFIEWRRERNSRQRATRIEREGHEYAAAHQAEFHQAAELLGPVTRDCPFGDDHTTEHIDGEPPHHRGLTLQ